MGYSKESALPEQKVYCHTYDSLVGVLADRMVIREKVLLPQEGDSFDHEDIYSWISAVDLEDKGPKIEASLSAERGKNPITIDVEKQETIKSDDEKVSNETLLYSMALTEAKMKVISDIAAETYPAIAFQIKDYRREMEKIREEILGSVEKGSSLDEILSRMSTRRGFLISTLVIAGMVLAACNHLSTPEPTATATPFQPQVTETSPAYETPGATETPFVEVTPTEEITKTPESGEYAELNMRIREFLNSEGAFTDEALALIPHKGFDDNKVLMEGNYLGIMETATLTNSMSTVKDTTEWTGSNMTQIYFQGIFLGEVVQDSRLVFLMGMVNKDGQRVVLPIGKNLYPGESGDPYILGIDTYQSGFYNMHSAGTTNDGVSVDDIDRLDNMIGNAAVFTCLPTPLQGAALDGFNQAFGVHAEEKFNEIDASLSSCRQLYNSVPDVRGEGESVDDAGGSLTIYDASSYPGIRDILADGDSELYYNTLVFVKE